MAKTKLDVMELQHRKELARKSRRMWESDWWMNIAYVNGDQHVGWDLTTERLIERVVPHGAEQSTHNICMPIVRRERAKILKTAPTVEALPKSDSEDDQYIAKVVNAQFREWRRKWKMDRRLRNASFWVTTTGNVWLKWFWNGDDVEVAVVPPFDIYPDPYAKSMLDCRWIIQTQFLDCETAKERYGKDFEPYESDIAAGLEGRLYSNYTDGLNANLPGVVVNEYWEPPSQYRPKGAFVVWANNEIVHQGDFPYRHGHMPFTHMGHIERSNTKWYSSVMDYMRGPQDEINKVEAQIIENRNLANGKWFIPFSLELEADPDASPRQVLRASGGPPDAAPQFIEINALPSWVAGETLRISQFAQDMAGQHEVSRGGVPGRVEAAQAIQLLQETDDEVLKDTIHSIEEAMAEGFWQAANLIRQYGKPKQVLKAYEPEGAVEVYTFMRDDIPAGNELRVVTQTTTGLPQSIAGRWDRVLNLWQYKIIEDPKQVLELLNLAPESPDLLPEAQDKNQAYRENKLMAGALDGQPRPLEAKSWNNHMIHLIEHRRYMNSDEYRALEPNIQRYFEFHLEQHEMLNIEEARKSAEVQAAAQGQPPMPPPGAAPPSGPMEPGPQGPAPVQP